MTPRPYHTREPRQPGRAIEHGMVVYHPTPPVRWDLVRVLERTIEDARAGRLQYFTGTGLFANGHRLSLHGGECMNAFAVAGAIEWLKQEFIERTNRDAGRE